jgi:hypothetical protein
VIGKPCVKSLASGAATLLRPGTAALRNCIVPMNADGVVFPPQAGVTLSVGVAGLFYPCSSVSIRGEQLRPRETVPAA